MSNTILKIKSLLKLKNISYNKLAQELGVTPQTVNNYLTGRTRLDIETLEKIADVLQVNPCYFFIETDDLSGQPQNAKDYITQLEEKIKLLEKLIKEKDKQIKLQDELIKVLKEKR